jgi:predicted nucleic acid-binding protein
MPELLRRKIVLNTSPTLALIAAVGRLDFLRELYEKALLPREVLRELNVGEREGGEVEALIRKAGLVVWECDAQPADILLNSLDLGEAAVIQLALAEHIPLVGIDELAGRRLARLCGLEVTGSLGILLKARKLGLVPPLRDCLANMSAAGIWLSPALKTEALRLAEETP